MISRGLRLSLGVALSLLLSACQQSGTLVTPVRFDRPRALGFACFDTGSKLFV